MLWFTLFLICFSVIVESQAECEEGHMYRTAEGIKFWFFTNRYVDWRTAESICDACELRLAQIESLEEDQEIIYEIQKNDWDSIQFWVSNRQLYEYDPDEYENWGPGEPISRKKKGILCMQINDNIRWSVKDCKSKNYVLCME